VGFGGFSCFWDVFDGILVNFWVFCGHFVVFGVGIIRILVYFAALWWVYSSVIIGFGCNL